jgi:predicted TIM-barrel fold metal-dependent hydrolase
VFPVNAFGKAGRWGPELIEKDGKTILRSGSSTWTMTDVMSTKLLVDPHARIPDLDRKGVDIQLVSSPPTMFFYQIDHDIAVRWATECNKALSDWAKTVPGRYRFFANLPLGDMGATLEELERARALGAVGIAMGSPVLTRPLSDEYFYPLYEKLNAYDMPVFVHPVQPGADIDRDGDKLNPALDFSKVDNILRARVGVLSEETLCITSLITGGTFDHFPKLKFCVPHAGGAIALHWKRLEETTDKHPGAYRTKKPFQEYLKHFYVDAIVHDPRGRKFVVDILGADNVVVGSNYGGWDAFDGFAAIEELDLSHADKAKIMGGNLARIFHLG